MSEKFNPESSPEYRGGDDSDSSESEKRPIVPIELQVWFNNQDAKNRELDQKLTRYREVNPDAEHELGFNVALGRLKGREEVISSLQDMLRLLSWGEVIEVTEED